MDQRSKSDNRKGTPYHDTNLHFELSQDLLCIANLEGYFIKVNPAFKNTLGYSTEELSGNPFLQVVHPEDIEATLEKMESLSKGKPTIQVENRCRTKGGSFKWLAWSVSSEPITGLLYAVGRDITEKKEAELRQQKQVANLHALHTIIINKYHSPIELFEAYLNKGCEIFGFETGILSMLVNDDCMIRSIRSDMEFLKAGMKFNVKETYCEKVIREGKTQAIQAVGCLPELQDRDAYQVLKLQSYLGTPVWVNGKISGTLNFCSTKEKKLDFESHELEVLELMAEAIGSFLSAEEARLKEEQLKKDLELSNTELERFADMACHDLKAPLSKIKGFGQWLVSKLQPKISVEEMGYLERIVKSAQHMDELVTDLLTLAKISVEKKDYSLTDLSHTFSDVLEDLELQVHQSKAQLIVDTLPQIEAYPKQLHQLLLNLISNAIKFHKPGQRPKVRIYSENGTYTEGGQPIYKIFVKDQGIGIKEKHHNRIFEAFQRLHSHDKFPGTGMGLAICKKIVEQLNGRIDLTSRPGEGSTFSITLPKYQNN